MVHFHATDFREVLDTFQLVWQMKTSKPAYNSLRWDESAFKRESVVV